MLLDSEQAAELLNVSTRTLREFVKAGDIAYVPLGAGRSKPRLGFTMDDINEFIKSRRTRECPSTSQRTPRITTSTSKSVVLGFTALQKQRTAEKQKQGKR
ncbi:helix-turn-helix domain-containing protein [Ensifer adhaerens]|uniref:helix-turn-helix domain-containing protein n=1 Tax=Ensifer adhaerens TaxID=106592 RepID=UPI003AF329A8